MVSTRTLSTTTVFNIDNKKKYFLNGKQINLTGYFCYTDTTLGSKGRSVE